MWRQAVTMAPDRDEGWSDEVGEAKEEKEGLAVLVLLRRLHADGALVVSDLTTLLLGLDALESELETLLLDLADEVATDALLGVLELLLERLLLLFLLLKGLLSCGKRS